MHRIEGLTKRRSLAYTTVEGAAMRPIATYNPRAEHPTRVIPTCRAAEIANHNADRRNGLARCFPIGVFCYNRAAYVER